MPEAHREEAARGAADDSGAEIDPGRRDEAREEACRRGADGDDAGGVRRSPGVRDFRVDDRPDDG